MTDGFAIVVANKLKVMSTEQKQLAEMLLLEVLHKGVNGRLTQKTHLEEHAAFSTTNTFCSSHGNPTIAAARHTLAICSWRKATFTVVA